MGYQGGHVPQAPDDGGVQGPLGWTALCSILRDLSLPAQLEEFHFRSPQGPGWG